MAYENLCMYCFEDNGGSDICPHCGRDARAAVPQIQLMPGTLIYKDRFLVGRALGQDASGIVYSALDTRRNVKIRIREYLPRDSARRLNSGEVVPEAGFEDRFEAGLKKLRASVEGVEDPTKRHFFFEENGTGYIAQRKSAGGAGAPMMDDEGEKSRSSKMMLVVVVAAALVLAVAVGVIALVSFLTNSTDDRTTAPITTGDDIWTPPVTASPTPYASATFSAIVDPENDWMDFTNPDLGGGDDDFATPTPVPTPDNEFDPTKTINEKSSPEVIKKLQKLLIDLGWLEKGHKTGEYDAETRQAVKDFQQYMNDTYAIDPKLTVDGVAGPKTLAWLIRTDLSRKPDPTPAPVTPNPSNENEIIDENAKPERIKYVQAQLVKLGILGEGYPSGTYDKTTRNGVAKFQRRVNDLQQYDALREDGTCDASTLAWLDYYVEWWEENKPTQSPTKKPTPAPNGEIIDENAHPESIKAVQRMLIDLGYLSGKADGVYGEATYDAVEEFQTFVNLEFGDKVEVTGKCDAVTLQYLEYCHANLGQPTAEPTGVPSAEAPYIEVTGYLSYANGVYAVGEDGVKISWKSEDAASYSIYLRDSQGEIVSKEVNTEYTSLSLSKDNLSVKETYTFNVTAIPAGGDEEKNGATSYVKLIAAADAAQPTPGPVSTPVITVSGALGYTDGVYQIGTGGAEITWESEGASAYSVYFTDADNNVVYEKRMSAITDYDVDPAEMAVGEKYTFTVVAIANGGNEADGEYASVRLVSTGANTPEPETTPAADVEAPVITVEGALGFREDIHWVGEDPITISWSAKGSVRAYSMYLTGTDGTDITRLSETDKTSMTVDPASMNKEVPYVVTVIAIPEGGDEEDGKNSSIKIQLYNGQTPEPTPAAIGAPVMSVSGHVREEEGIYYARKDALTISWTCEGEVASYDILIMGSDGNEVLNKTGVKKTTRVIAPEDMTEGVVYTMTVTAIPDGGTADDGQSASVMMGLYVPPVVGTPEITIEGYEEYTDDIYYMGADGIDVSWFAENAASYSVYLNGADGKVVNSAVEVTDTQLEIGTEGMKNGEVYTLTVIAIPEEGGEKAGVSAAVKLALVENTPVVGVPEITIDGYAEYDEGVYWMNEEGMTASWVSAGAKKYNVYVTDASGNEVKSSLDREKATIKLKAEDFTPGEACTLTVVAIPEGGTEADSQSASVYVGLMEEEPKVGAPVISPEGYESFDGSVYYLGDESMTVKWESEGAATYSVYVSDPEGKVVKSDTERKKAQLKVDPSILEGGKTYTFTVIAIPEGGKEQDGQSAYVLIALSEAALPDVEAPVISVENYADYDGGIYYAGKKDLTITWKAKNAESYNVYLKNEDGENIRAAEGVVQTEMTLDVSGIEPGVLYTLYVGAVDEKGRAPESAVSSVFIMASEEELPEETPVPEVKVGVPEISVSGHVDFANETYYVGTEKISVSYSAEKAATYDVTLLASDGTLVKENIGTDKTSINVKPDLLTAGEVYTLSVIPYTKKGAAGESAYVMIALYEDDQEEDAPGTITPETDPEIIESMQKVLYELGWLTMDMGFEKGVLDEATVQAIYDFQEYVIEQGLNPEMVLIDPEEPEVDPVTISMLADKENPVYNPMGDEYSGVEAE